jgi:ABC-type nitrate/sulfonate/bicarbonate transport system ATPase subunit
MDSRKAFLQIDRAKVSYKYDGIDIPILEDFSCNFEGGKIYVLMGPNGCGKSTLLKLIIGELELSSGTVEFKLGGEVALPCIDYIPQNYRDALFPWKKVSNNVWPWKARNNRCSVDTDIPRRVEISLEKLGLSKFSGRYPYELSGGQQQAILLARSIAANSTLIIMDEPFSALDVVKRTRVADLLREEWMSRSRIVICAMHEPDEAAVIADGVLLLDGPVLRIVDAIVRDPNVSIEDFRKNIAGTVNRLAKKGG